MALRSEVGASCSCVNRTFSNRTARTFFVFLLVFSKAEYTVSERDVMELVGVWIRLVGECHYLCVLEKSPFTISVAVIVLYSYYSYLKKLLQPFLCTLLAACDFGVHNFKILSNIYAVKTPNLVTLWSSISRVL